MLLEEEHDEREDWQAQPLVCFNERAYWQFWIWLYGRMREREE